MNESAVKEQQSLESLVGQVADEFLRRQERGEHPDVEEYAARYPDAAELLRKVLVSLQVLELSQSGVAGPSTGEPTPKDLGDFRLLHEIGRGGMGVVYEAEQISLGRRVALKVLPFAATMDPRRLQRFHNEAKAAACLHHTNIVPVFAVGSERGVHFYAMQLIDGVTLASVIHDLQPTRKQTTNKSREGPATTAYPPNAVAASTAPAAALTTLKPGGDAAYFRKVAELGMQAAEALDYAHQIGVVHRDIKPGNLMLDSRGMVWITDFGLAHLQTDSGVTLTGDLVGTLRYMSPEQALAKRVPIDHRTDVYSLGATLYELLTFRPVFTGEDRQELLRQIAFEEPIPPRRLQRAIPAELETIVLKALEKKPQDRYATAQELADDLRRHLEDKAIHARRPSLLNRFGRWRRRHKSLVTVTGGLLFVLVVVLAICTLIIAHQRDEVSANLLLAQQTAVRESQRAQEAREQKKEADKQRDRAQESNRKARQAVTDSFTLISENQLLNEPSLDPLRKELLETALTYYKNFLEESANDPALQAELAAAYLRVAQITQAIGSGDEWLVPFEKGIAVVEQLVRENGKETELGSLQAGIYNPSRYLHPPTHPEKVLSAFQRGRSIWEELVRAYPEVSGFQNDLAGMCNVSGLLCHLMGRPADAIPSHERARELWQNLVVKEPKKPSYRESLALNDLSLAESLQAAKRSGEAETACKRGLSVLEQLITDFPTLPMYRCDFVQGCIRQSEILLSLNRLKDAEEACLRAQPHAEKLVAAYPTVLGYRWQLSIDQHTLGVIWFRSKRFQEAEKAFRNSLVHMERLASDYPDKSDFRINLVNGYKRLTNVLLSSRQFQEAVKMYHRVSDLNPKDPVSWRELSYLLANCEDPQVRDPVQAVELAKRAVQLAEKDPRGWRALGLAHFRAGSWKSAITAREKAIELGSGRTTLDDCWVLTMAHWQLGQKDMARQWYDKAIDGMEKNKQFLNQDVNKGEMELQRRYRQEATALLGIKDAPPTDEKKPTTPKP